SSFEEFQQKFPDCQGTYQQLAQKVYKCVNMFLETCSVLRKKDSGRPSKRTAENIEEVEQRIAETPNKSIRRLTQETNLSFGIVQLILKKDLHFFPNVFGIIQTIYSIQCLFFNAGHRDLHTKKNEILTPFLTQLHDDELVYGYFQQDGATAHTTRATIDFLTEIYDNRIISRNTPNNWSPRSCDLTPCDFFLWPHIKNSIY
ncbi:unnamed protein product, partial [Tenebrio molitor]